MYDIIVNGQVVAVVVTSLLKPFVETLVRMLPEEMSIQTKIHQVEESSKEESASKEKK